MAQNLQLANKCNLFSQGFAEEKSRNLAKISRNIPKTFRILAKDLRVWEALLGLLGLQKVHKNEPGIACPWHFSAIPQRYKCFNLPCLGRRVFLLVASPACSCLTKPDWTRIWPPPEAVPPPRTSVWYPGHWSFLLTSFWRNKSPAQLSNGTDGFLTGST